MRTVKVLIALCGLSLFLYSFHSQANFTQDPAKIAKDFFPKYPRPFYESEDVTAYRFFHKPDFGKYIRVNIGYGAFDPVAKQLGIHEDRHFFLPNKPDDLLRAANLIHLFRNSSDIQISNITATSPTFQTFNLRMTTGNFITTVNVDCQVSLEVSGPFRAYRSTYYRQQMTLNSCKVEGQILIDKSWITIDAHSFEGIPDRSGLHLRTLYLANYVNVRGRSLTQKSLGDLILTVSDKITISMFRGMGHKYVDKNYLWKHTN